MPARKAAATYTQRRGLGCRCRSISTILRHALEFEKLLHVMALSPESRFYVSQCYAILYALSTDLRVLLLTQQSVTLSPVNVNSAMHNETLSECGSESPALGLRFFRLSVYLMRSSLCHKVLVGKIIQIMNILMTVQCNASKSSC